jgi:hypothetical protein
VSYSYATHPVVLPDVDGCRKRPVGLMYSWPVDAWQSTLMWCAFCAGGSRIGGAASCCWFIMSSDVGSIWLGHWRGCVDLTSDRCWSKWPICMATNCGVWRRTCADFNPGHVVNHPASMASHHVESTGENSDVW